MREKGTVAKSGKIGKIKINFQQSNKFRVFRGILIDYFRKIEYQMKIFALKNSVSEYLLLKFS